MKQSVLLLCAVSNQKAGRRGDKWSIKTPFEAMVKLVRPSSTSFEPKNVVQLSEQHHLSQHNWLSGSINETRQNQPPVTEAAVRDVVNPSVGRQNLPAKFTRMSIKSLIDSNRPSVLDFVKDKNELPKMFYMEHFIRQHEDSFLKAEEYLKLPCQDSSDCHDTSHYYENPPEEFHRPRQHRPTQQPAVPFPQNHQNRRPQINAHPFPLIIKGSLQGAGLLKYFQLTPDD